MFVIHKPDVFRGPGDNYVVFGAASMEDSSSASSAAADMFAGRGGADASRSAPRISSSSASSSAAADGDEDESVDETGIMAKDIELVMTQAGTTRAKAVKALRSANNDIVTAIMSLTME